MYVYKIQIVYKKWLSISINYIYHIMLYISLWKLHDQEASLKKNGFKHVHGLGMLWVAQAHLAMSHATTLVAGTQIPVANERLKQQAFCYPRQKIDECPLKRDHFRISKGNLSFNQYFFRSYVCFRGSKIGGHSEVPDACHCDELLFVLEPGY